MDEHGETVWRFTLVAPSDGNAHRLNDLHELCQFLRVETDELERAADAVKI